MRSNYNSAIGYRPSAIGYRPSAISYRLSAIGHRLSAIGLSLLLATALLPTFPALAASVDETPTEFLTSGDFNGDGLTDAVLLDKQTGNARVAYADLNGALTWSAPLVTGVPGATSLAAGRFLTGDRDAIAVTALDLNRIHLVNLSGPSNGPPPVVMQPAHPGVALLVGLEAPYGTIAAPGWIAAGAHDPGLTLLDLFAFLGQGLSFFQDQIAAAGYLASGQSFRRSAADATLVATMQRGGSNDTFLAWCYTNTAAPVLSRPGLAPGTEYAFGRFNNEPHPRLLFYVPNQTNIIVQPLIDSAGAIVFGTATMNSFTSQVQRVYVIEEDTNALAVIHFGDGLQGARLPSESGTLQTTYRFGASGGNVPAGVVPLGVNRFALLSAPSNAPASTAAQVFSRSGSNYVQTSSSTLPSVTGNGTRANVWLFASEPFVNAQPGFVASRNGGDWIRSVNGLPGLVTVVRETDQGASQGLGTPAPQSLGAAPAYAQFGLPNQYHPAISIFSYSAPRAAEPVIITITPPPGRYPSAINVSFQTLGLGDEVYYRLGPADAYQLYAGPFLLATNAQVQYYGVALSGERSSTSSASYTFANDAGPIPAPVSTNGNGGTNLPPGFLTNQVFLSANGTVFYGRASGNSSGTIWAINLDGSGETYLTTGFRPRVSRDGRRMAFLRNGSPLVTQGNMWVRDLWTGQETLLYSNLNYTVGYDWDRTFTNLVFDWSCWLWRMSPGGTAALLPLTTDCYDDAPVVNPVDGRLALHDLNPSNAVSGLYVTAPDATTKQRLNLGVSGASWPAWSPDGQWLVFADGNSAASAFTADAGKNLWVVRADGTSLNQISGFTDPVNGFPHGALYSLLGDALVGAGTIFGTNGLWLIPLSPDGTDCEGMPIRLPTSPGPPIDFAGTVIARYESPILQARREASEVVVFWRRDVGDFTLETSADLSAGSWTTLPKPYVMAGSFFEYRLAAAALRPTQFFRLRWP